MLHEEVTLDWNEMQGMVQDFHFMESVRSQLVVGVSLIYFSLFGMIMYFFFNTGTINVYWSKTPNSRSVTKTHVQDRNRHLVRRSRKGRTTW